MRVLSIRGLEKMVLMRASSDEISSVRIRLRADMGQRLAVEDERGGIHLLFSLDFLPFLPSIVLLRRR